MDTSAGRAGKIPRRPPCDQARLRPDRPMTKAKSEIGQNSRRLLEKVTAVPIRLE
jgi:hypothetical protein